jgi:hypothetical protein
MPIRYNYFAVDYVTEQEAQQAVVNTKARLDNNPTDWCVVKQLTDNANGTYTIPSNALTDSEINSLSVDSVYLAYSIDNGFNHMPLSSEEVYAKISEWRSDYVTQNALNKIFKVDGTWNEEEEEFEGSVQEITPNVDMSGYV